MKGKLKRFSHSTLAFVLTMCMLLACVNVGVIDADAADTIDAGGSSNWKIYLSDFTTYNNAYNTDITINTSGRLSDGYLKLWLEDENKNKYGGEEKLNYGGSVIAASGRDDAVWLANADIYSDVTVRITWDNGAKVEWISGTLNTVDVAAGVITGQTSYGSATVTLNSSLVSSVAPGTQVDFNATANTGYSFVGWYSDAAGNTLVSEANPYHVTINNAATYYAKFEKTKDEYYNVNFTAGPHGSVSAKANGGIDVTSGKTVKWGTRVVFTAAPDSGYSFSKWTGTNGTTTINTTDNSYAIVVKDAVDIKAWFTDSNDGEDKSGNGNPYFRWGTATNNVSSWPASSIKVKNGRAYGYIDSPSVGTTYYFSVSNGTSGNDYWTYNGDNVWNANSFKTDFGGFVTVGMGTDYESNEDDRENRRFGAATLKSVSGITYSRIKVDLGEWKDGKYQTDYNTFRVIPVFDTDETNVDIYAKNSAYRSSNYYDYFYNKAKTVLTDAANIVDHTVMQTGSAMRGDTITVTTTIDSAYRDKYYVKGFSFNGVTPSLHEWNASGVYSETYKIPADFSDEYLEITPIYYYNHNSSEDGNYVQFYIENYDEALQATGWGNTLFVYPYYSEANGTSINNVDNAYGGYPGQPVINYGGRRFIEIPTVYTRDDITGYVKGVTLSNGFWDIVHREYVDAVPDHKQTYDYDDFYKIYKESYDASKDTDENHTFSGHKKVVDQITFAFKYRTATNNFSDSANTAYDSNYARSIHKPYSSFTEDEKTSKFANGWEDLLDYHDRPVDLFGTLLTENQKTLEPVLVVSDDYQVTYAGYYATTWTVYEKEGTSYTKKAEIAPSALIVTDKSRLAADNPYPAVTDRDGYPSTTNTKLADYTDEYQTLEAYRGRPVLITYERAIENNSSYEKYYHFQKDKEYDRASEVAIRSDGRWLYSYYNDEITANIRIEYKNDESDSSWTEDPFKAGTNTGTTTGASAYFTNTNPDIYGLTDTSDVTIYSDPDKNFTFTATRPGGYIFQGWWLEKDGIATRVTENDVLSGASAMTSNATFVARYVKTPSGTLTINHTLLDGSVGGGDTYVKVVAKKAGEDDVVLTSSGTDGFVKNQFEINSDYVSYRSGYTFEVTLKTVPENEFSVFEAFSAKDDVYSPGYLKSNNNSTSGNVTTNTFTVSVEDLFELDSEGFPTQKFDSLTYYSNLTVAEYNYEFVFKYTSYDNVYGEQSATVKGKFSADELNNYMKLENGDLSFKSDDDKSAFLNSVAPYENNFMTNLSWNTSAVEPVFSGGTLSGEVASTEETRKIKLNIKFPYAHKGESDKFAAEGESPVKLTDPAVEPVKTYAPEYGKVLSFNNVHENFLSDTPEYLTAPEKITDGSTELYFRYWKITTNTDGYNDVEYARSYNREFDYVLFQDCTIEPVYTPLKDGEAAPTPRTELQKDETGVTITFMENSRNQYNNNGCGSISDPDRQRQGDRIYTDFLISANTVIKDDNNNPVELNTLDKGTWTAGLVIQRVGRMEPDSNSDGYLVEDESVYKERYADSINLTTVENIARAAGSAAPRGYLVSEFDAADFNNKNRINYYYSMPNRDHSSLETSPYQYQVYCAYAYLRSADRETVYVSEVPVFFTIYEIGNTGNDVQPID